VREITCLITVGSFKKPEMVAESQAILGLLPPAALWSRAKERPDY